MKKIPLIASLVFAISLSVWFAVRNDTVIKPYPESHLSIADRMATEASHIVSHQATVIVLGIKGIHEHEDLVRIFTEKLKLVGNFHIVPTLMNISDLKLLTDPEKTGIVSAEEGIDSQVIFDLLKQHPKASALVSFAGPPALQDKELRELQSKKLKMIVFAPDTSSKHLRKLLEANVIQVAVTRRLIGQTSPSAKMPDTLDEWFDTAYEVVTPAKLAELSRPPQTKKN
jgi:hypothetical protein